MILSTFSVSPQKCNFLYMAISSNYNSWEAVNPHQKVKQREQMYLPTPPPWEECDTRSIFKQSLTGWNLQWR